MLTLLDIRNAGYTVGGLRKQLAGTHREVLVRCECKKWEWVYLSRIKFKIEHGHKYRCRPCGKTNRSNAVKEQDNKQTGHLVLTRRRDESIMIGHDIVVTILQVDGGKVRIGIRAPGDVTILREELYTPPVKEAKA